MPSARPAPLSRLSFMSGRSVSSSSSETSTLAGPPAPVEASSLASVFQLADDPPLYRPFPTKPRASLILWIVRVPDSRDLILTTLTPPRHSPSARATDIAASLYYFHVHSPDVAVSPATLIRRNPSSGVQTNVCHILPAGETIQLELPEPGYQKFQGLLLPPRPQDDSTDAVFREWQAMRKLKPKPLPFPPQPTSATPQLHGESQCFTREMHIEGEGFWKRMKHRHSKKNIPPDPEEHPRERVKKKKDFVFEPPWTGGRCEFKDEGGGKFLKCKYYMPGEERSTLLSVIEFKPPSLVHRRSTSEAGGAGMASTAGKVKAKMGMLVVHSAGQEMLDLLVAANLVAFLRRWEAWGKERAAIGV